MEEVNEGRNENSGMIKDDMKKDDFSKKRMFIMYDSKYAVYDENERLGMNDELKDRLTDLGLSYVRDVRYSEEPCTVFEVTERAVPNLEERIFKTVGVVGLLYDGTVRTLSDIYEEEFQTFPGG